MARSEDRAREKRLNKIMKDLKKIDPLEILPYLTCLSTMGKEKVRATHGNSGPSNAATEMFEQLTKRENWYKILVDALRDMEEDTLADKLEGPEKKSDSPGPSQNVAMSGTSSHSAHVNQSQGQQLYQSQPGNDPCPPGGQQRHPEAEASLHPGHPLKGEQKDTSHKGEKRNDDGPAHDVVNVEQPLLLPMPIQERRPEPSDPRSGQSVGPRTSNSSTDLQVHGESSPRLEDRPTHTHGEAVGEANDPACTRLPSNISPTAGGTEVSVRPKVDAALRRMEEEKQKEEKRNEVRSAEGRRAEENWNIENELSCGKNLPIIQNAKNYPEDDINLNKLSPTKDCREFFGDNGKAPNLEAPNVVEGQSEQCVSRGIRSLSPYDVDTDNIENLTSSVIHEGISRDPLATPAGSRPNQIDEESAVSTQEAQVGRWEVSGGDEEGVAGGMDASNETQNSLLWSTISSIAKTVCEHVLTKP